MYSGSDSTESQKYPQWALNPSAYQNMANDQVDWAALAQQWIIMKEAGPPPIPGEVPVPLNNKQKDLPAEGGEAPMDVEDKDDDDSPGWNTISGGSSITQVPPPNAIEAWNWNVQNQSWAWNNSWTSNTPGGAVPPQPQLPPAISMKPPLLPTPGNQFSAPPESSSDNAVPFGGYNSTPSGGNEESGSVYYTNKQIKPHNRRYSKVNVPRPVPTASPSIVEIPILPTTLDAAKRKQLPAWIREGLEKMERDKIKHLEKEREKLEQDAYNEMAKASEKEKMEILKTTMKEQRSKFESDNEYSGGESPPPPPIINNSKVVVLPDPVQLTPEELMLKVRRTMTEILLSVTTHYIQVIGKEEHERYIKKYKASDHRASAPSGANISAKLGLGIYGGESDSNSGESGDDYQKDKRDSDTELKDTIKRKMSDFFKTEKEIEMKLAEAEYRKAGNGSRSSTPDTNDNDSQVDARLPGRKVQRIENRTPPPHYKNSHDNSKSKKRSTSSSRSNESEKYVRSNRNRSSSSGSNDSRKKSKSSNNSKILSRSHTPEKKYKSRNLDKDKSSSSRSTRRSRSPQKKSRHRSRSSNRNSKRSRSRSYSRSKRSSSSSYSNKRSKRRSRSRNRSESRDRSRYAKGRRSKSISRNKRTSTRRRSRSVSSGRGKRSHKH